MQNLIYILLTEILMTPLIVYFLYYTSVFFEWVFVILFKFPLNADRRIYDKITLISNMEILIAITSSRNVFGKRI